MDLYVYTYIFHIIMIKAYDRNNFRNERFILFYVSIFLNQFFPGNHAEHVSEMYL